MNHISVYRLLITTAVCVTFVQSRGWSNRTRVSLSFFKFMITNDWLPIRVVHTGCTGVQHQLHDTFARGADKINRLEKLYANCTVVYGNVEIRKLSWEDLRHANVTSLDHIFTQLTEINGYLVINYLDGIASIQFPRLRYVWGVHNVEIEFHEREKQNYTMTIGLNKQLEYVGLPALRVVGGAMLISGNSRLCHWQPPNVDWSQLVSDRTALDRLLLIGNHTHGLPNFGECDPDESYLCHPSCSSGHCWGPGPQHCQIVYRDCPDQCDRQCYTPEDNATAIVEHKVCCHQQCEGGCTGPSAHQCYACKGYRNGRNCVDTCPGDKIFDHKQRKLVKNTNPTFFNGKHCVRQCPAELFIERLDTMNMCTVECREGHHVPVNDDGEHTGNECVKCDGVCTQRACEMKTALTGANIEKLGNCTQVHGFLEINFVLFGEPGTKVLGGADGSLIPALTVELLEEHLSAIRTVSDYIYIHGGKHFHVNNLDFLRNLRGIFGQELYQIDESLKSYRNSALVLTHLDAIQMLPFQSLREIRRGHVIFNNLANLCFQQMGNITNAFESHIFQQPSQQIKVIGTNTLDSKYCDWIPFPSCDAECDPEYGCFAAGPSSCFACLHFVDDDGSCVHKCDLQSQYVRTNVSSLKTPTERQCHACHPECNGCTGESSTDCLRCRHERLNDTCVSQCPINWWPDGQQCQPCAEQCENGCTGAGTHLGAGGCNACEFARIVRRAPPDVNGTLNDVDQHPVCILDDDDGDCSALTDMRYWPMKPVSYKNGTWRKEIFGHVCIPCPFQLITKVGADDLTRCVDDCRRENAYVVDKQQSKCHQCHAQCDGCTGPNSTQCLACKNQRDFPPDSAPICVPKCPLERNYSNDGNCTSIDVAAVRRAAKVKQQIVIAAILFVLLFVLLGLLFAMFLFRHKFYEQKKTNELIEGPHLDYFDPTANPNLAYLRIIPKDELKRGGLLGNGAFGIVTKGIWRDSATHKRVPVAIKEVAHSLDDKAVDDIMTEAGIMAAMEHKYLVKLIGICLNEQGVLLVTPLMPSGSLLNYIITNKNRIPTSLLLLWCQQIAEAMEYLEQKHYVHRDLAARNVLVQTPYHTRVTDFGLTKVLQSGQSEVFVEGRVPVKWLALECIRYQRFTHKSDVWAYGVTVWEILTFGARPYGNVPVHEIRDLLERGERLPQPDIATTDLYLILIKCWMVDAEMRPTFSELSTRMAECAASPCQFLAPSEKLRDRGAYVDESAMMRQLMREANMTEGEDEEDGQSGEPSGSESHHALHASTSSATQRYQEAPNTKWGKGWLYTDTSPTAGPSNVTALTTLPDSSKDSQSSIQLDQGNYLVPNRVRLQQTHSIAEETDQQLKSQVPSTARHSYLNVESNELEAHNVPDDNYLHTYVNERSTPHTTESVC